MSEKFFPITYLNWILLWINAIRDSYLWIDSPDCFFFKIDYIQWNHDLNSNLRKANWEHKFLATISDVNNIIDNRNNKFEKTLLELSSRDFVKIIFISSMPMCQLIWTDYDWLISIVKNKINKPIFNIPSKSMTSCWLDWYSDLLFSLAKNINIIEWEKEKNNIAIIWNLFDRNEWDCLWNIEELKNIFEWLWLNVVSIWLDWWEYENILNINKAWTIISLPYWRKAAKKISLRLNIWLLELDLPFWLNNTINFIKKIWEYFKISQEKIDFFINKELKEKNNIWIVKWWINNVLFNKNISYYWDPYLLNWIIDISETFGFNIKEIFIHWEEKHLKNNINEKYKELNNINFEFKNNINKDIDLFISSRANKLDNIIEAEKILEFGFPSYLYHCFTNKPYYWIKWSLNFINRVYNNLSKK